LQEKLGAGFSVVKTLDPGLAVFPKKLLKILKDFFYIDRAIGADILLTFDPRLEIELRA
jgi:hypothetical protein